MSLPFSRTLILLGSALALSCGDAVGPPTVDSNTSALAPPVPTLSWAPCADNPGFECATAIVPLDYDHPHGATTEIALARLPATANKIGSIFLNPGGPGSSGVNLVLSGFADPLAAALDGRFDIIGFDPRGVAASDPMQCFDSLAEVIDFLIAQPGFPHLESQELPFFEHYTELWDRCASKGQPITTHMSTADVARDLDLLRQAVGDARLNFIGFSYGSYIGNTYANLFPNRVRAMVLDGVLDPRLRASGLQIISDRVSTAQVFDEFVRLCDEAGPACALSGPEGTRARFDDLVDTLLAGPIILDGGFEYRYDSLITDASSAMYSPELWPDYAEFFDFLHDAVFGAANAAMHATNARRSIDDRMFAGALPYADYPNVIEAYYGVQCADVQYPSTFFGWELVGDFAAAGSIFGPIWWWPIASCANWPISPDRYIGPWRTHTSKPVLVVGNFFDPATNYTGALATNELLRNSRLLSYAGWGHTAFERSACVFDYVVEYLRDGSLPPKNTVCPANPSPFLAGAAARSASGTAPMLGRPPLARPIFR